MAYLFLGTKAKEASEQNDIIRIYKKKAAAEMNVDQKYSYQLFVTFGLWQEEQNLETIASDDIAKLQEIKNDIIRLYEEIYGKHVEKHKIIEVYLKYVDEAVEHIRKMCQDIDKELLERVEDLSEIFQRRINEIRAKLDAIIAKYIDPAKLRIETDLEELIEIVSLFKNYDADRYQNFIDVMFTKFEEYLTSKDTEEEIRRELFEKAVNKLIKFENALDPFVLDREDSNDVEHYNTNATRLEELVADIKAQAATIKEFTFKKVGDKDYQFEQNDDYEYQGETHDLDGDGNVYVYGEDDEKPIEEAQSAEIPSHDSQAISVLGQDVVDGIKEEVASHFAG